MGNVEGAMSDIAAKTSRTKSPRKQKASAVDLVVNKNGADYKAMVHAYATGERVSTKGMTREQVLKLITG